MEETESSNSNHFLLTKQGGCCSEIGGGPDFSLLSLPFDMDIDRLWLQFWFTAMALALGTFIKPLLGIWEYRTQTLTSRFGKKAAFNIYSCCTFIYSVMAFVCFHQTLHFQHRSHMLQNNQVLLFGYIIFVGGLILKIFSLVSHGWSSIIGDYYFYQPCNQDGKEITCKSGYDPHYHPYGTSSVLKMIGQSLIMASGSGLCLCFILGVAYLGAYRFERFLLSVPSLDYLTEIHFPKVGLDVLWSFNLLQSVLKRKIFKKNI